MLGGLRKWSAALIESWAGWVGDRDLEVALRGHLDGQGFWGDSARFRHIRLVAVQRPGWLMVFAFNVEAKSRVTGQQQSMFGLVRQDERYNRVEIEVFPDRGARTQRFLEWSQNLIRVRNPQRL